MHIRSTFITTSQCGGPGIPRCGIPRKLKLILMMMVALELVPVPVPYQLCDRERIPDDIDREKESALPATALSASAVVRASMQLGAWMERDKRVAEQ